MSSTHPHIYTILATPNYAPTHSPPTPIDNPHRTRTNSPRLNIGKDILERLHLSNQSRRSIPQPPEHPTASGTSHSHRSISQPPWSGSRGRNITRMVPGVKDALKGSKMH